MISVVEYNSNLFCDLVDYCESESNEKDNATENMWAPEWESMPNTLLYILTKTERFSDSNGQFHLLFDSDKLIGCAGVYISNFSNKVCLAGVRAWISRPYRGHQLVRNYLLPKHKAWALQHKIEIVAISFNSYNKNLIKLFSRGQTIYNRTTENIFHSNFNIVDFPVLIQGVPQWLIYEQLSGTDIDWSAIKYSGPP